MDDINDSESEIVEHGDRDEATKAVLKTIELSDEQWGALNYACNWMLEDEDATGSFAILDLIRELQGLPTE